MSQAFYYNLTLTKQEVIFTSPNYTVNPGEEIISTYNFLNPDVETAYLDTTSSSIRTYSINLHFKGLVDSYTVRERHFA